MAHTVAQRAAMPSPSDQVSYLRAQLAHREAQLEQVRAERDNHFVQEEEILAHLRLLSSEAKDWKSRVVTEAEEVLCRESAQAAQHATKAQETMDKQYQARWRQAEAELRDLRKSNNAQIQSLASKLHETQLEHQQLYTAQERQLQLEAQTLRQSQHEEQQAAVLAQEHEISIRELRRQAEEQPELLKLQRRRQLSQQASYTEIYELYTEMLNMREKSETKSALSAQMCRLESPSRSVESEPEDVLNTASPGRCSSWILPHLMMRTPDRPTTGGLQSPVGEPVQLGPSPLTQPYSCRSPVGIPPAQWGNHDARKDGEEECELFRDLPQAEGDPTQDAFEPEHGMEHQDELNIARLWQRERDQKLRETELTYEGKLAHLIQGHIHPSLAFIAEGAVAEHHWIPPFDHSLRSDEWTAQ